ncbi:MAG: hypothetical protein R3279_08375, partial [Putridiphycobacter sp.]|nr:hypothetical protein [Putridiphycobacter sp.]
MKKGTIVIYKTTEGDRYAMSCHHDCETSNELPAIVVDSSKTSVDLRLFTKGTLEMYVPGVKPGKKDGQYTQMGDA